MWLILLGLFNAITNYTGYYGWWIGKYKEVMAYFNPLKMKRRLLYLNTQSVPRSKHFSSRL